MTDIVTTTAHELAVVLGATIPFAEHTDYGYPTLAAIQLHAGDGVIAATATNRFVLAYARTAGTGSWGTRFILDVEDAHQARKALTRETKRSVAGGLSHSVLTTITVSGQDGLRKITMEFGGTTMTFREVGGASNAPQLGTLITDLPVGDERPEAGSVALTAQVMKPFLKTAKRWGDQDPMRWTIAGPTKPIRVEIGDWFIGCAMPACIKDTPHVEYVASGAGLAAEAVPA